MFRSLFTRLSTAALCLAATTATAAPRLPELVLAGPPAAVSFPLIRMVDSGVLADLADKVEFVVWRDPDHLRVLALEGKPRIMAMPTNVAANLYNRGARLKLINVSTWGILWLVSRSPDKKTLADFKGEEIAMPFRADMPDIVFQTIAAKQGLDPRTDFKLRYVGTPLDAMQLLITRRVDHALLAEPAVSMALRRTSAFPVSVVAPTLYRSVDLQQEWGRVFGREARMPQAGIVAVGALADRPDLLERIHRTYAEALGWCQQHALTCAEAVAQRIDLLTPEAVADAIAVSPLEAVAAPQARAELTFFFGALAQRNPALIGGRLPDDDFYARVSP